MTPRRSPSQTDHPGDGMRGMGRFWKKLGETIGCGKPPRKTGNKTRRSGLKIAVGTLLFVIVSTALPFLLRENHLSTNMDALLPADPWIAAHLDFLRNSRIGSTAAVSLEAKPGADPAKLPLFAERFAKLTSREPLVGKVFHRIPPRKATNALAFLCLRMPQILSPTNLNELEKSSATNRIGALMRALYKEMTRPGALFRQKLAASDPLSLHQKIIAKLRFLAGNSGFRFHPREDGLWSDDGRHLLVLVRTEAPISDAGRGESFVEALKRLLEASKPSSKFNYIIMAGHRHAVDNRRLLQRDITVTMTVAAIGFILLFSFLFRDWRAVFVFIVPFLGMGSAIGLTWLFFDTPSAIILGMGATVIGIALDYGIHVFVAAKAAGTAPRNASTQPGDCVAPSPQNEKNVRNTSEECGAVPSNLSQSVDKAVSEVIHPIVFSALTTLGVFWAFFLSSSPGYHQLAFASTCGIALSVWISLTCLPLLFKIGKPKQCGSGYFTAKLAVFLMRRRDASPNFVPRRLIIPIWLAVLAASALAASKLSFQPNIRALDGIGDQLRYDEKEFRNIWGESSQAAVSVKAPTFETALERHDEIAKLAENAGIPGFQSLSMIWPSLRTRKRNAAAWDAFWSDERVKRLKREFREIGARYSFSENAFAPFFDNLRRHDFSADFAKSPGFDLLREKFLQNDGNGVRLDAFFDDAPTAVATMRGLVSFVPGASVVSPKRFGEYISESILSDARRVAMFAFPLVLLLAWICLQNLRDVVLALIPVLTALALEFPAHAFLGLKLNAIALVAMIVVTGLAVDYGIFAVSAVKRKNARFAENAVASLTISMLSTAIGSGALLFAAHPALRTVGLVVTVGVTAAWASAVFAVPALHRLLISREPRG